MNDFVKEYLLRNKLPFAIAGLGIIFPILVYKYVDYKTKKLNDGIKNDMDRVLHSGKRFIDIERKDY